MGEKRSMKLILKNVTAQSIKHEKKKRTIQFSYANVDSFSFQPLLFSLFEKW